MPYIPLLSNAADAMQGWQDNVVDDKAIGHGLRSAYGVLSAGGRMPITPGIDPVSLLASLIPQDDANAATAQGLVGKEWVDAAYKNAPWQHFLTSSVMDPINLVGMGIPGAAMKGVDAASTLGRVLKVADIADKVPGRVTSPIFDLGAQGAGKVFQGAADLARPAGQAFERAHPDVASGVNNVMRAWREQALLSPGYHVRNATENVLRPFLAGDTETAKQGVRGLFTGKNRFDDIAAQSGFIGDPDIMRAVNQDPTGLTSQGGSVMENAKFTPEVRNMRTQAPAGMPDGTLVGDMGQMPSGVQGYKGISHQGDVVQAGDDVFFRGTNTSIGNQGTVQYAIDFQGQPYLVVETRPGTQTLVKPQDLYNHTPGPGSPVTTKLNPAQEASNWVTGKMADASNLNRKVGSYVEGQARKGAVATEYERRLAAGATPEEARKAAVEYADELFFNYGDNPTGVDDLGRNLFAFHKFATHNIPAQLKEAGARPAIMNVPANYYRSSDEYNDEHGLSSRFHGEMPIGNTGWHINPLKLSSMGEIIGAATEHGPGEDQGTVLGHAADTGSSLGLGLNPFIDALLTVTGQHGRTFAPGFLRASQPVNGLLSSTLNRPVDIEGFPKEMLGNAQEALTGQQPFPYQEYLLRKRQAELGALGGDVSQAGSDVGNQMADEGIAGFLGIPGLKYLSPEEQTIRQNQELAKAYRLAGNLEGYRANPTAGAYAELDPRDEQVANWDKLSVDERNRLLRDPEVRDQLLDKLAMQLHNTGSSAGSKNRKNPNPFARPTNPATIAKIEAMARR